MNRFQPVVDLYRNLQNIVPRENLGSKNDFVIVMIDAGHGGLTASGQYLTAPDKMANHGDFMFYEGVWNRAVVYKFAYELYNMGKNYLILEPGDKDTPLYERIAKIKEYGKEYEDYGLHPYVVSIHANAFFDSRVNGIEVYTSPGNTKSDPIAAIYYSVLSHIGWKMRPGFQEGGPDKEARFTILTDHKYPAILPEIGFFTNREQAIQMCKPLTINLIAQFMRNADIRIDELNMFKHRP